MKQTSATVLALLLANVSAHKMSKLSIHRDQLIDVGVRFATGMNGDEDLGQDITMKGEKFHYNQMAQREPSPPAQVAAKAHARAGLPMCNGGNGVAGLDCTSAWNYPKKTNGRPYGPMNDAYTPDGPTYASRLQTESHHRHHHHHKNRQDDTNAAEGARDNETEENQTEVITPMPYCHTKTNGNPGVDCRRDLREGCTNNVFPADKDDNTSTCRILPVCTADLVEGCYHTPAVSNTTSAETTAGDATAATAAAAATTTTTTVPATTTTTAATTTAATTTVAASGLVQIFADGAKDAKDAPFEYPAQNPTFVLPELPECTGLNGADAGGRKVQCRQIGRYTGGSWFVQTDADLAKEEAKAPAAPDYKSLNAGTPRLPECTGMNGDRRGAGWGSDCRQIGRFNGPWPVTDDVQIGAINGLQNLSQLPTCDQWITTNCQPVCTRDLTTGCTEERTPEPPRRDRFEGKWTHKPGQTTIQPRILPEDGVTNNYQH